MMHAPAEWWSDEEQDLWSSRAPAQATPAAPAEATGENSPAEGGAPGQQKPGVVQDILSLFWGLFDDEGSRESWGREELRKQNDPNLDPFELCMSKARSSDEMNACMAADFEAQKADPTQRVD